MLYNETLMQANCLLDIRNPVRPQITSPSYTVSFRSTLHGKSILKRNNISIPFFFLFCCNRCIILFYSILVYSILFPFALFRTGQGYSILLEIPFYHIVIIHIIFYSFYYYSILFWSILFCSILHFLGQGRAILFC